MPKLDKNDINASVERIMKKVLRLQTKEAELFDELLAKGKERDEAMRVTEACETEEAVVALVAAFNATEDARNACLKCHDKLVAALNEGRDLLGVDRVYF